MREIEQRNGAALQRMAEMVDEIPGIGPVITKQLFEKGLAMPPPTASPAMRTTSRARSRSSVHLSGRESEISCKLLGDDDEMLSKSKQNEINHNNMPFHRSIRQSSVRSNLRQFYVDRFGAIRR